MFRKTNKRQEAGSRKNFLSHKKDKGDAKKKTPPPQSSHAAGAASVQAEAPTMRERGFTTAQEIRAKMPKLEQVRRLLFLKASWLMGLSSFFKDTPSMQEDMKNDASMLVRFATTVREQEKVLLDEDETMRDEIQTALQTTAETMVDEIIDKHNAAAQAMPAMEATESVWEKIASQNKTADNVIQDGMAVISMWTQFKDTKDNMALFADLANFSTGAKEKYVAGHHTADEAWSLTKAKLAKLSDAKKNVYRKAAMSAATILGKDQDVQKFVSENIGKGRELLESLNKGEGRPPLSSSSKSPASSSPASSPSATPTSAKPPHVLRRQGDGKKSPFPAPRELFDRASLYELAEEVDLDPDNLLEDGSALLQDGPRREVFIETIKDKALEWVMKQLPDVKLPPIEGEYEGYYYDIANIDLSNIQVNKKDIQVTINHKFEVDINVGNIGIIIEGIDWKFKQLGFPYANGGGKANAVAEFVRLGLTLCLTTEAPTKLNATKAEIGYTRRTSKSVDTRAQSLIGMDVAGNLSLLSLRSLDYSESSSSSDSDLSDDDSPHGGHKTRQRRGMTDTKHKSVLPHVAVDEDGNMSFVSESDESSEDDNEPGKEQKRARRIPSVVHEEEEGDSENEEDDGEGEGEVKEAEEEDNTVITLNADGGVVRKEKEQRKARHAESKARLNSAKKTLRRRSSADSDSVEHVVLADDDVLPEGVRPKSHTRPLEALRKIAEGKDTGSAKLEAALDGGLLDEELYLAVSQQKIIVPTLKLKVQNSWFSYIYNLFFDLFRNLVREMVEESLNEAMTESSGELLEQINDKVRQYLPSAGELSVKAKEMLAEGLKDDDVRELLDDAAVGLPEHAREIHELHRSTRKGERMSSVDGMEGLGLDADGKMIMLSEIEESTDVSNMSSSKTNLSHSQPLQSRPSEILTDVLAAIDEQERLALPADATAVHVAHVVSAASVASAAPAVAAAASAASGVDVSSLVTASGGVDVQGVVGAVGDMNALEFAQAVSGASGMNVSGVADALNTVHAAADASGVDVSGMDDALGDMSNLNISDIAHSASNNVSVVSANVSDVDLSVFVSTLMDGEASMHSAPSPSPPTQPFLSSSLDPASTGEHKQQSDPKEKQEGPAAEAEAEADEL